MATPFRPVPNYNLQERKGVLKFLDWERRAWRRFDRQFDDAVNAYARGEDVSGGYDHAALTVLQ